ncbi:hypothetical protein GCM10009867_13030 [Pedococcus aerophilus]|uniref:HTH merR-type domain-containing protein n=1 Tax=Pedococcus aerophilus TaxID=436356 RepID=A0ABN3UKG7_9MICO
MPSTPIAPMNTRVTGDRITRSIPLRVLPDLAVVETVSAEIEWSVGVVADRLDIPAATLRSWDRRYGVSPSQRSAGGHRRYTEGDVLRVAAVQRFVDQGVPTQTAARVALAMDPQRLRTESLLRS